jgi:hypothetical protein
MCCWVPITSLQGKGGIEGVRPAVQRHAYAIAVQLKRVFTLSGTPPIGIHLFRKNNGSFDAHLF